MILLSYIFPYVAYCISFCYFFCFFCTQIPTHVRSLPVTYAEFDARWKPAGGAERANYGLFLQDLCDLIGVDRPDPTTDNPAQDAYVLERAVEFQNSRDSVR